MRNVTSKLPKPTRILQRFYSPQSRINIQPVRNLCSPIESVDIQEFRQRAFLPEKPILITSEYYTKSPSADNRTSGIPAAVKWFEFAESGSSSQDRTLSYQYLSLFGTTILPYEFIVDSNTSYTNVIDDEATCQDPALETQDVLRFLGQLSEGSSDGAFHRFNAPLSLFLQACKLRSAPRLYIAQAQIADLPKELQDDLPTPKLVKEAGKGDVYDSNIWIGIPPTYTPLHKDPNPNFFIQLASSKRVRIFKPSVGSVIYRDVQRRIGHSSPSSFRGDEMMEGPERDALNSYVWQDVQGEGYEAIVSPGDALFIPKGWWHSIKSIGTGITASVNWWFR